MDYDGQNTKKNFRNLLQIIHKIILMYNFLYCIRIRNGKRKRKFYFFSAAPFWINTHFIYKYRIIIYKLYIIRGIAPRQLLHLTNLQTC